MTAYAVKLPDVGEGVAEAELVSWCVAVGDRVGAGATLAEVMTDKATVEVASPVAGVVSALHGEAGDVLAVGAEFVTIEMDEGTREGSRPPATIPAAAAQERSPSAPAAPTSPAQRPSALAAPAVRARASALGIDLAAVTGSGPDARVLHEDLDRHLLGGVSSAAVGTPGRLAAEEPRTEAIRGVRRRIAARLTTTWSDTPHITYVDSVDATDLEALRAELNRRGHPSGVRLTMLPFLVRAVVIVCGEQPRLNAHYDHATETLSVFDAVHAGIATQTAEGLVVPVVRHAEARGLWDLAAEIARLSGVARDGTATRHELTGSTISITSLGALGGLVTTPILNAPEVAIVGVNKMEMRPVWRNGSFEPRQVFNLSSSFDHRIVDGWDAATFVQRIKTLLEMPALLFVPSS